MKSQTGTKRRSKCGGVVDHGYHCAEGAVRTGRVQRLSHKQRETTPIPFRDLLISIARSAEQRGGRKDGVCQEGEISPG